MKKLIVLVMVLMVSAVAVWGGVSTPIGPAPNAGDGISDGIGVDSPAGPSVGIGDAFGPAPSSGDGVSDGSGLESPNGIV